MVRTEIWSMFWMKMSLQGRRIIEGIKSGLGGVFRLPCPPFGNPAYWSSIYSTCQMTEVIEWGDLTLEQDLLSYRYQTVPTPTAPIHSGHDSIMQSPVNTATFSETIGVDQDDPRKSVMILGCGYSKLGEDMATFGWKRIVQVDIVSKVVLDMSERCQGTSRDQDEIKCIEDDASKLTTFDSTIMDAVIDKGLVDTLHLADEASQMRDIMTSTHRVLKPNGIFCFFSLSQPKYLLPKLMHVVDDMREDSSRTWHSIQVRQLSNVLLYRFQKQQTTKLGSHATLVIPRKKFKR